MSTLGPQTETGRGFPVVMFEDTNGAQCSLQVSSFYGLDHVWLGVDNPDPKILASQASQHGVATKQTTGWVPFYIPEGVSMTTRIHLSPEKIEALIRHLQTFLETGEFEVKIGRGTGE